ncbi:MAG: acyl carrier protein [Candidatus Melainabacteria bacterium]|nr:acyl carrier protein [Candidatus Melainabacteria bacterium]
MRVQQNLRLTSQMPLTKALTREGIINEIAQMLSDYYEDCNPKEIHEYTRFSHDLGADSLDVNDLSLVLGNEYGLEISVDEIDDKTVRHLVSHISANT